MSLHHSYYEDHDDQHRKFRKVCTLFRDVIMMVIAFYLSKSLISNQSQQRAITIECGLQNGTLAIVVANLFFDGGLYLIPAATYSLIMYATSLSFIYFLRRSQ